MLDDWNRTDEDYPQELCLHQRFERQAARTPDAVALSGDDCRLTYAELETRLNHLAHQLRLSGIGRGALVALYLERSPAMIAAILGTLKAGAAYVPIDRATPAERLRLILADTGAPLLLVQRSLVNQLPQCGTPVLYIDDHVPHPGTDEDSGSRPPQTGVKSSDLAYVIYTSGSTGRPKSVMVEHRAIGNTVSWRDRELTIYPGDRVLYALPYTFDPSLCIIFPTLAAGARIILASPGEEYDPHRLLQRLLREEVTILEAPPAMLRLMLDDSLFAACRALRWVCCGGEAMPRDLPRRMLDQLDVALYNLYGPTEAAVDSAWWTCRRDDPRPVVPIGRPIANARAYVLDAQLRPVPPGRAGRAVRRWGGAGARLLEQPGPDGRAILPQPVRGHARGAPLQDGRPLPLDSRRGPGVSGTSGPAGKGARFPCRAGRG
jgi:amino acid adenylation domain-containing protein